ERVAEELRFSRAQEQARTAAADFVAAVEADPTLTAGTAPDAADADVGAAVQPRPDDASNADSEAAEDAEDNAALSPIGALAASHGGTWHERAALERTAPNVPSEVLTTLFAMPPPADDAPRVERVSLA